MGTAQAPVSSLWTLNSAPLYTNPGLSHLRSTLQWFHIQWFTGLCSRQLSTQARPLNRSQPARATCTRPRADCMGGVCSLDMLGSSVSFCSPGCVWGFSKPRSKWKEARPSPGSVHGHACLRSQIQNQCLGRIIWRQAVSQFLWNYRKHEATTTEHWGPRPHPSTEYLLPNCHKLISRFAVGRTVTCQYLTTMRAATLCQELF